MLRQKNVLIPDAVLHSTELTAGEVRLYGVLLSFCERGKPKTCCVSLRVLAAVMGVSTRTISGYLATLRRLRLIVADSYDAGNGPPTYGFPPPLLTSSAGDRNA